MKKDIASQNVCVVFYEVMEWSRGNVSLEKRLCEYREKCSLFFLIFLYCFQRCVSVKIFAEIGFCWKREKVLLGGERFAVVLKRTQICLFFNRVFVLSELSWCPHNPLLTVGC